MKLKNKKTGEILESARSSAVVKDKFRIYDELNDKYYTYDSLAELNAEWEDYEETKEYYYYIDDGGIISIDQYLSTMSNMRKSFGNYFGTREEAEKAVEKLKAWKRLRDKGFMVTLQGCKGNAWLQANWGNLQGDYSDVILLFGGKE